MREMTIPAETAREDEEFFQGRVGRPDADDMEEAINKFLDDMEGQ